jgi:hypothetical protein
VDEQLTDLERQARANPGDAELAERCESALLRAGEEERLRDFFRFGFECPMQWRELTKTADPLVRHCERCEENVHFAVDTERFEEHTRNGRCVAVLDERLGERLDAAVEALAGRPRSLPRAGCLVPGVWHELLLDALEGAEAENPDLFRLGQGPLPLLPAELSELAAAGGATSIGGALQEAHQLRQKREQAQTPFLRRLIDRLRGN